MIVAKLQGGLGNQMFQYALGRCLAVRHKTFLFLETSSLIRPGVTSREYGLSIFNIQARFTTKDEIIRFSDLVFYIHQIKRGFHRGVLECSHGGNIVLDGYWQNELYFKEVADIIREEFTFKSADCKAADQLLREQISSTAAICVHIRRGDYLLPQGSNFMNLDIAYYKRAVKFIAGAVQDPHFYFFSDDIDWCEENLPLDYPHTFIRRDQPATAYTAEDFRLMTMCRYFIIANSSFSWWAAWLGAHHDKIVVAPKDWFRHDASASKEIVPANWVRL
jgi:Glycosyl transferase family 11